MAKNSGNMISIFLLILISAILLPEIARAAGNDDNGSGDGSPMVMLKSTLKTWHSMYNSYREEINLGYCWADYFLDIKKLLSTLAGPRFLGLNPDDPSPLIAILKSWFDDGSVKRTTESAAAAASSTGTKAVIQTSLNPEYNSPEENYEDYDCGDQELSYNQGTQNPPCYSKWNGNSDQFSVHQLQGETPGYNNALLQDNEENLNTGKKPFRYFYPGIENSGRNFPADESRPEDIPSLLKALVLKVAKKLDDPRHHHHHQDRKSSSRALSDLFISVLGFDVPPGLGPLMLGSRGGSPMVIIISRMIGTLMRVGKQVLDTIERTSFLACSKEYLLVKMFRWIDS